MNPSAWVCRWVHELPVRCEVLDLACGNGRHTHYLHEHEHRVLAVDRHLGGMTEFKNIPGITLRQHDLESKSWPFPANRFGAIVVSNYLHRPLFPVLADSLRSGGLLIYETFAMGNEQFGRPRNPDFLLRPGELRAVFGGLLRILDYEELTEIRPVRAVRQRVAARKSGE
jgi:SAM-dependent methyltransferase